MAQENKKVERSSSDEKDGGDRRTYRVMRSGKSLLRRCHSLYAAIGHREEKNFPSRLFSMYVALTYIPGGGLLTGFAMRSDPKGFSGLVHH